MNIQSVSASGALDIRQLAQPQRSAAQGEQAGGTQALAAAQPSAAQPAAAKPAGAKPAGPPPGGGGAKPAANSSASSESSSSDTSKIYDKRDADKDGVVSYEEEMAYAAQHPDEAEKSQSGASSSQLQAGLRAYREVSPA